VHKYQVENNINLENSIKNIADTKKINKTNKNKIDNSKFNKNNTNIAKIKSK